MLLIRQISPQLTRYAQRFYRAAPPLETMNQVLKEQLLHVKRDAKITIRSDIYMKICSTDVLSGEGTALCAELNGGPEQNQSADMKITVSEDKHDVEIVCSKLTEDSDRHCSIAVPILADLNIETKDAVSVQNMYNREVRIKAQKDIRTKDIKSADIKLLSESGDILCEGMFLGDLTVVETKGRGNITLDKPQGNLLECKTEAGNITTNSCYVDSSKFTTDTGSMNLKNVHKKSQVFVNKQGDLNVSGFHGNLFVRTNGGSMNLQLSEINDENIIMVKNIDESVVNIADSIEELSFIEIAASEVKLDSPLSHLSDGLSEDKSFFRMSTERDNCNKLKICANGIVKLGKLSWAESMKIAMGMKKD